MKRTIYLFLLIALVLSLAVSCDQNGTTGMGGGITEGDTETPSKPEPFPHYVEQFGVLKPHVPSAWNPSVFIHPLRPGCNVDMPPEAVALQFP